MEGMVGGKDLYHGEFKEMMIDGEEDSKFARYSREMLVLVNFLGC